MDSTAKAVSSRFFSQLSTTERLKIRRTGQALRHAEEWKEDVGSIDTSKDGKFSTRVDKHNGGQRLIDYVVINGNVTHLIMKYISSMGDNYGVAEWEGGKRIKFTTDRWFVVVEWSDTLQVIDASPDLLELFQAARPGSNPMQTFNDLLLDQGIVVNPGMISTAKQKINQYTNSARFPVGFGEYAVYLQIESSLQGNRFVANMLPPSLPRPNGAAMAAGAKSAYVDKEALVFGRMTPEQKVEVRKANQLLDFASVWQRVFAAAEGAMSTAGVYQHLAWGDQFGSQLEGIGTNPQITSMLVDLSQAKCRANTGQGNADQRGRVAGFTYNPGTFLSDAERQYGGDSAGGWGAGTGIEGRLNCQSSSGTISKGAWTYEIQNGKLGHIQIREKGLDVDWYGSNRVRVGNEKSRYFITYAWSGSGVRIIEASAALTASTSRVRAEALGQSSNTDATFAIVEEAWDKSGLDWLDFANNVLNDPEFVAQIVMQKAPEVKLADYKGALQKSRLLSMFIETTVPSKIEEQIASSISERAAEKTARDKQRGFDFVTPTQWFNLFRREKEIRRQDSPVKLLSEMLPINLLDPKNYEVEADGEKASKVFYLRDGKQVTVGTKEEKMENGNIKTTKVSASGVWVESVERVLPDGKRQLVGRRGGIRLTSTPPGAAAPVKYTPPPEKQLWDEAP
jgi:hypothetical protein